MPVPVKLGVAFTPAEITAMQDAAKLISDTIKAKVLINLSEEERQTLSKVGDNRFAFAAKSIKEYGVEFPQFNGIAYPIADADNDFNTYGEMGALLSLMQEATERATELQMVAGHFMFQFLTDQYANAERNLNRNVAGAQVVYDGLKACFEGQGPQNPTPPTS